MAAGAAELIMSESPPQADPLLDALWEKGLILFGERVQQEYGLHTPIFIDLRHKLYDDLELLTQLGAALHRRLRPIVQAESATRPQQVIGIPDTATPIALSVALQSHRTDFPVFYGQMRKKPAEYPGGASGLSSYMGTCDKRREITLIDDVMASGRTKVWAISELRKDGLDVKRVLVVVDREQGANHVVEDLGCPVYHLYRASSLIEYYEAAGKIDAATAAAALAHVRAKQFG
jgi:uridine monophosphate synthetase